MPSQNLHNYSKALGLDYRGERGSAKPTIWVGGNFVDVRYVCFVHDFSVTFQGVHLTEDSCLWLFKEPRKYCAHFLALRRAFFPLVVVIVVSLVLISPYQIEEPKAEIKYRLTGANRGGKLQAKVVVFPQGGLSLFFSKFCSKIQLLGAEATGPPPWTTPKYFIETDANKFLDPLNPQKYIYGNISFTPGLGNILFQYVSLRAIAKLHNAKLIIKSGSPITRAFHLSNETIFVSKSVAVQLFEKFDMISYSHCCRYYSEIERLEINRTRFRAYFQSFRYFHPRFESDVRKEFTFLPEIQRRSRNILDEIHGSAVKFESDQTKHLLIGVHVRRG